MNEYKKLKRNVAQIFKNNIKSGFAKNTARYLIEKDVKEILDELCVNATKEQT